MRLRRRIETVTARSASDRFFTGRLTIVDVRSDAEFAQARVPGATHIPLGQLRGRLPEVRGDRPIAFLCRSGHRSALAARGAAKRRADVASIDGGMEAWIAADLPTARCRVPRGDRRTA
jgi:rhodanese-related sulfurtransferase